MGRMSHSHSASALQFMIRGRSYPKTIKKKKMMVSIHK